MAKKHDGKIISEILIKSQKEDLFSRIKDMFRRDRLQRLVMNLYEIANPYKLPEVPGGDFCASYWGTRWNPVVRDYVETNVDIYISCETNFSPPVTALSHLAKEYPDSEITIKFRRAEDAPRNFIGEAKLTNDGVILKENGKVTGKYDSIDDFIADSVKKEGKLFDSAKPF